jgi:glutaredoxin-related protein
MVRTVRDSMKEISGENDLPQIFVDGKFKSLFDKFEMMNEDGDVVLREWLGIELLDG